MLTDRLPTAVTERLPGRLGDIADRQVVSVLRLHGVITPAAGALSRMAINVTTAEPLLRRAFAPPRLAAVALVINSPGGAATQSALVADRIRGYAEDRGVPVLAFCEDVAASGGYWLACAADEIYAHPTSLVGSIGVVSGGFGLVGLLDRLGVERRLHTAGQNKARLDPFLPERAEDVAWLKGMQAELHELFKAWVRQRRGSRLDSDADLFTGEVWTGERAVQLGLVDGLGTPRSVLDRRFPDAEPLRVDARRSLLSRLGLAGAPAAGPATPEAVLALWEAAESRAIWARYGL
jgi:signal peptide peptidase SppA